MRKRSKPETVLQARIVEAIGIAFPRALVLRTNAGQAKVSGGMIQLAPKGFFDLVVLLPRVRVVLFEVKTKSGELSPEQEKWFEWADDRGYPRACVRAPQEALNFIARHS